ncbi:hypothetical protein AY600_17940 [Phormidium willei BDU 130791]|nr:hypothetical protein AY600_17940 [Phormidium willei BDU 130791]
MGYRFEEYDSIDDFLEAERERSNLRGVLMLSTTFHVTAYLSAMLVVGVAQCNGVSDSKDSDVEHKNPSLTEEHASTGGTLLEAFTLEQP